MTRNEDNTWLLTSNELAELTTSAMMLDCLKAQGVDNWEGYEFALEMLHDLVGEKEND